MSAEEIGRSLADRMFDELSVEEIPQAFATLKMRIINRLVDLDERNEPAIDKAIRDINRT